MRAIQPRRRLARSPRRPRYRPQLLFLEERLPLGDGVLGALVGASLLGAHAAVQPTPQNPAVSAPRERPCTADTAGVPVAEALLTDDISAAAFGWEAEPSAAPTAWSPFAASFARSNAASHRQSTSEESAARSVLLVPDVSPTGNTAPTLSAPTLPALARSADDALLVLLAALQPPAVPAPADGMPSQETNAKENFGKLSLYFEQNVGQTDDSVRFLARGPGYGLFLTATEAVLELHQTTAPAAGNDPASDGVDPRHASRIAGTSPTTRSVEKAAVVRMQVLGGNPAPTVIGRAQQPGIVNYFLGNDPAQWHTNIHTYAKVEYQGVYPGIDLVYYGSQRQFEYDFVVAPGVDPNVIRLGFAGADGLSVDGHGDLVVSAGGQELRQHRPVVYQETGGARQEVPSRFVLDGPQVGFQVGAYDASKLLVIDPVLSYSTYLGGSSWDLGEDIALDPTTGDAFVTGLTSSPNFPIANPLQPAIGGGACPGHPCYDVFVARLRADDAALVYSTYLGGSGDDIGNGLALDATTGSVFVTGSTASTNFPTANPLQPAFGGSICINLPPPIPSTTCPDAFVARLRGDGAALVFSTYLGSNHRDYGSGIAVDPTTGSVFVTGYTSSPNFPIANPLQPALGGGSCRDLPPPIPTYTCPDAFVARLRGDGAALVFSTFLGGNRPDSGAAIALDPATGSVFVTGTTESSNFPTANALQPAIGSGGDAFVTRLRFDGAALVYSTYLGGSSNEVATDIAVDPATGSAFVTGHTYSTDFPTSSYFGPPGGGAYVTKLTPTGSALVYSAILGGASEPPGGGGGRRPGPAIALDPTTGDAFVVGQTYGGFPTVNPFQPTSCGTEGAFVARLRADGSSLVYSGCLGGNGSDAGTGIAVDPTTGSAYVTGRTDSTNFPTINPLQPTHGGNIFYDAFVARIDSPRVAYYFLYPFAETVTAGQPFDLYLFALDASFNVIPDYAGQVYFWSSDPLAQTPAPYTFRPQDGGVASFPGGITLRTPGTQVLLVFDAATFSVYGYGVYDVRPA